jgi:hypothetical protein
MVYLKITCGECGNQWTVTENERMQEEKRYCKDCGGAVDLQTWTNSLLPAMGYAMDSEKELIKAHKGHEKPLYSVDILSDSLPDKDNTAALMAILIGHTERLQRKYKKLKHKRRKRA